MSKENTISLVALAVVALIVVFFWQKISNLFNPASLTSNSTLANAATGELTIDQKQTLINQEADMLRKADPTLSEADALAQATADVNTTTSLPKPSCGNFLACDYKYVASVFE